MELDEGQTKAVQLVSKWYKQCLVDKKNKKPLSQPIFYLAGYAGVGKTTIANYFRQDVTGIVRYGAFTGKAALMMIKNKCPGAQTVHSMVYKLDDAEGAQPTFELDINSTLRWANLLILDECSMINNDMGADLLTFKVPILVLGDPGQLPPPSGTGFFTNREPDILLTHVHRQALDSDIIRIATCIRSGKKLAREFSEDSIIYPMSSDVTVADAMTDYTQMITGKNTTRRGLNNMARERFGCNGIMPEVDDRIICLRNNKPEGLFNGLIGTVTACEYDDERTVVNFVSEDNVVHSNVQIHSLCFSHPDEMKNLTWKEKAEFNEFDYAYAVTCHKAQGSQWESVAVMDDGMLVWDRVNRARWLYTAVTRAQEKLLVMRPPRANA